MASSVSNWKSVKGPVTVRSSPWRIVGGFPTRIDVVAGRRIHTTVARTPSQAVGISHGRPTSEEMAHFRRHFGQLSVPRNPAYISARRGILDTALIQSTLPKILSKGDVQSSGVKMASIDKSSRRALYRKALKDPNATGRMKELQKLRTLFPW